MQSTKSNSQKIDTQRAIPESNTKMQPLPASTAYLFLPYPAHPSPSTATTDPPLRITNTSTYTYCGPLLLPRSLPASLHTWSRATTSSASTFHQRLLPLLSFLHTYLSTQGISHYWLTLRATLPTHDFDTPRWHVDDDFFTQGIGDGQGRSGWKLCTTLLGPGTLFLPLSDNKAGLSTLRAVQEEARQEHACTSIRCCACFASSAAVRSTLSLLFADLDPVRANGGEVAVFRTGAQAGAVHSEPACDVERVFVNVVPGSEEGLRALMGRFGMRFPRAWSVGVPGGVGDGEDGLGS